MENIFSNKYTLLFLRIIPGLIFIFAGIEKIASPESFAVSIENYRIVPLQFNNIVAITLPWLELITGLLLVLGISVRENIFIINALLLIFIIMVLSAIFRGLDIDCGCFGTSDGQKVGFLKIIENTGLFLIGIIVFYFHHHTLPLLNDSK